MSTIEKMRLDKWLWAARFFKTRSMATDAINGGKVHLNGDRVKAAHAVKVGDEVRVRREQQEWTVIVRALNEKRRPASEAVLLYEETDSSRERREAAQQSRRDAKVGQQREHRPSKKERREILRFKRDKQRE